MGRTVIVVYRPREGKEKELQTLIRDHVPVLQRIGLATTRPATILRAADGCFVEIFEWASTEAIQKAHSFPEVKEMWAKFSRVCDYECPARLKEFNNLFSEFETIRHPA